MCLNTCGLKGSLLDSGSPHTLSIPSPAEVLLLHRAIAEIMHNYPHDYDSRYTMSLTQHGFITTALFLSLQWVSDATMNP